MKKPVLTLNIFYDTEDNKIHHLLKAPENMELRIVEECITCFLTDLHNELKSNPTMTVSDIIKPIPNGD